MLFFLILSTDWEKLNEDHLFDQLKMQSNFGAAPDDNYRTVTRKKEKCSDGV